MTWHMLLWISPHILLVVVAVLMYQRGLHRDFPAFWVYTLYETGEFAFLYTLNSIPSITGQQYTYAFLATLAISIALRFGVIREVSDDLFREREFLREATRGSLRWTKVVLVFAGIASAIWAPGEDGARLIGGLAVINRGVGIIQCGLLVFLLGFSRLLGLSWRGFAFGIALGIGVLSSVDIATYAIRAQVVGEDWAGPLNLLTTGGYLICASIWLGYTVAPESRPFIVANVSGDEVEEWNHEIERWLRP
jgi:hypothetical protein